MNRRLIGTMTLAAVGAALLTATGCSPTREEVYDQARVSAVTYKQELSQAIPQLDSTMKSLTNVMSSATTNREAAFKTFQSDLGGLRRQAALIQAQAGYMRDDGQAYFAAWDRQIAGEPGDAMPDANAQRTQGALKYSVLQEYMQRTRDQYMSLLTTLKDTEASLATDMSSANVQSLMPKLEDATKQSFMLKQSLGVLVAETNKLIPN
ncbi:MAG: DUF2959 family protein [Phycisphaeraceae bacterium]|nr:DUF2959 family protein [Phycisphaeraceae bacterium]